MARGRKLSKTEKEVYAEIFIFLIKGYFSPLAQKNGSLWVILIIYALCLLGLTGLKLAGLTLVPALVVASIAAVFFAFYHYQKEQEEFDKQYREHHAQFAPPYDSRFALPEGQNKIYAYKIHSKDNQIKVGQTTAKTADRVHDQLKTANIEPNILWEIYARGQKGQKFNDYALHRFLVQKGYTQVKAATGRKTEWFNISSDALHKEVFRFYTMH